jgi:hypothetical protein
MIGGRMKKLLVVLMLWLGSGAALAQCGGVFEEDFTQLKLMRVAVAKTNFLDKNSSLQPAFVLKNDLVLVSGTLRDLTCAYFFAKNGSYTGGYLKTANLERNSVQQNLAGFWSNDAGDNKISVQANLSFRADLSFRSANGIQFGDVQGRFIRFGAYWRYKKSNSECLLYAIVVNNVLLVSGGQGCELANNVSIEGIYTRK